MFFHGWPYGSSDSERAIFATAFMSSPRFPRTIAYAICTSGILSVTLIVRSGAFAHQLCRPSLSHRQLEAKRLGIDELYSLQDHFAKQEWFTDHNASP